MKVLKSRIKYLFRAWSGLKRWVLRNPWKAFLIATAVLVTFVHFYTVLFVPPSREKIWKEIQVADGMSFRAVSALLSKEGIVRSQWYFEIFGRIQGISRKVRAGYYGLGPHMSMWEVLRALRTGRIIEYAVTVPEGYNLYQIAYVLSRTPLLAEPFEFIKVAKSRPFVQGLGIDAETLEGYLFPDTYYFAKGSSVEAIARRMVQHYRLLFADCYRDRAAELGYTEHEIITLASIIEKEAKVPSERTTISAVYHNRLKGGMKLQADPTAVYGTRAWVTKVTSQDLKRKSPYNTYLHKGLPPGPIANPGKGAILAALHPEPNGFLFFVAQGDGSHYFSEDYDSHTRAVERLRINQRIKRRTQAER